MTLRDSSARIAHVLLAFACPKRCIGCGAHIEGRERHLCPACVRSLRATKLVMPLTHPEQEHGTGSEAPGEHRCARPLSVSYALPFEGVVRATIHAFKYQGAVSLAGLLASAAARAAPTGCDLILPVPLHSTRRRERGYDQTLLIAHGLGAWMTLPVLSRALARTRSTDSQAKLERGARFANTLGAFQAREEDLSGRRVLLLDDVVTTGATLSAAGAAVLEAGADHVSLVAVAGPAELPKRVDSDPERDYPHLIVNGSPERHSG